jgi:hypothetical protein
MSSPCGKKKAQFKLLKVTDLQNTVSKQQTKDDSDSNESFELIKSYNDKLRGFHN